MKRIFALIIALTAIASIAGQFTINGSKPGLEPWLPRIWDMLRYFTILTNGLVAYVLLRETVRRPAGSDLYATGVLNIAMVGIIYQILLAPEVPLQGFDWWPDFGFHTFVPVAMPLWWIVFGPVDQQVKRLWRWLLWPTAYCLYALIRGLMTGRYPYFFLDVEKFGAVQIAINITGLVGVFAIAGIVVWLMARAVRSIR